MLVSVYKHYWDESPYKNVELQEVIKSVMTGHFKELIEQIREESDSIKAGELKKQLPLFKMSGTFMGLSDSSIDTYNGIVQIDIDKMNPAGMERVKEILSNDLHTIFVFVSPSGKGLKAGFLTDNSSPKYHKQAFKQVESYINKLIAPYTMDESTKAIGKSCFLSFDYASHYKTNPKPYHIEPIEEPQPIKRIPSISSNNLTHKGGRLTPQHWDIVYMNLPSLLPEMQLTWDDRNNHWISPKDYGGGEPQRNPNKARTIAELGTVDGIVLYQTGQQGINLIEYIRTYQNNNIPIKTIKEAFGWWI